MYNDGDARSCKSIHTVECVKAYLVVIWKLLACGQLYERVAEHAAVTILIFDEDLDTLAHELLAARR